MTDEPNTGRRFRLVARCEEARLQYFFDGLADAMADCAVKARALALNLPPEGASAPPSLLRLADNLDAALAEYRASKPIIGKMGQ